MESRRRVPIPENIQVRFTKLYVSNLPEGCSGVDLASQVRQFGQIFDLYIARKRDKNGNRFGFISILDVKDKEELLRNLRGIRMGDNKLWFNIARFVLEDGEIGSHRERFGSYNDNNSNPNKSENQRTHNDNNTHVKEGIQGINQGPSASSFRSFKDLFVGKSLNVESNVNAFSAVHGKALVVKMVNVVALKNIYVFLKDLGLGHVHVQYLGGLDVLISFDDADKAKVGFNAMVYMKESFTTVSVWEGQSLGFERIAWVKIQGVPLHLCTNEVFDRIGGLMGKIVYNANVNEKDRDLSFEYIGELVGDGQRIVDAVTLNWKNKKYRVWIVEEQSDWVPDFVSVDDKEDRINYHKVFNC